MYQHIDADFETGLTFKDKVGVTPSTSSVFYCAISCTLQLCPDAFRWYTGEACDSDDDEEKVPDEEDEYEAPLEQEASAMFGDGACCTPSACALYVAVHEPVSCLRECMTRHSLLLCARVCLYVRRRCVVG